MRISDWSSDVCSSDLLSPPPIQGLGTTSGFTFRLQDRGGLGQDALSAGSDRLMAAAGASPVLAGMRIEGMPDAAQVQIVVDREKANTFGVTFADINTTISTNLGSTYVNDFPRSEEHTSELPSLMRISYAVFCLKKK